MRVVVCRDADEGAEIATREILAELERKPDLVLGLATGSTPIGIYQRLVAAHRARGVSFARVRTFNLDEYYGLPPGHPQSYRSFMEAHLFGGIDVPPENIHFPPTSEKSIVAACARHEAAIRAAGGIDVQILGIGTNGHIGFNEPTSSLASRTRLKTLAEKTVRDNARFYPEGEKQPTLAATLGIGTILDSRRILLQAFGTAKAEAVRRSVEGPVSSMWPGSALQLHADVTFLLDEGSASELSLRDYFRRVRENEEELRRRGAL